MKRTIEIVLTVIGLIFSVIGGVFTAIIVLLTKADSFKEGFEEGYTGEMDGSLGSDAGEAEFVLNILTGFGWMIVAVFILGSILGIISIFFYMKNKKPKAASIILIITSIVVGIGTVFTGFLPALLYLIAGIVGLVRKPPVVETATETL